MKNQNQKITLIPDFWEAIEELVKRYRLGPTKLIDDPELEEVLSQCKTPEEEMKIIENLLFFNQLKKIVKKVTKGEISLEGLASVIQKRVKISQEIREKVFIYYPGNDLRKPEELEVPPPSRQEIPPKLPPRRDIYREPIE